MMVKNTQENWGKLAIREIFYLKQIQLPADKMSKIAVLLKACIANILIAYVIFMAYIYLVSLLYYFLSTFSFGPHFALYSVRWVMFDQLFSEKMYLGGEFFIPYQLAYLIYIVSVAIYCLGCGFFCRKNLSPVLTAIGVSTALCLCLTCIWFFKVASSVMMAVGAIGFILCPFYLFLIGYNFFVVFGKYLLANKQRDYYNHPRVVNSILGLNVAGFLFSTILYINIYAEIYFKKQRMFLF